MSDPLATDGAVDPGDLLDGCELDFTLDPDDDETVLMRALFPEGDPARADEWRRLFDV